MANTERDITRADNIVAHRDEIMSRPKKTWFESEKMKSEAKQKSRVALNGPENVEQKAKDKKGKLSHKQKKKLQDRDDRRDGKVWRGKSRADRAGGGGKPQVKRKTKK